MVRALVDQNHVVLGTQLTAQICSRNYPTAAAAQYNNLFSSAVSRHRW
jgi:hypothetical protein